jgi:uncharacterized RDD family membrane protein YckC
VDERERAEREQRVRAIEGAPAWFDEPTFGQRLGAAFVDGFLFLGIAYVLVRLTLPLGAQRALMSAVTAGYLILAVTLTGRTLGKKVFGLRVVDHATGELPGLRAAVLRWLVPAGPALVGWVSPAVASYTAWFSFVVFLPILKGPQHRGIHDLVAGTIVTRSGRLP